MNPPHSKRKSPTTLTDLPPELFAAIASELPTASSIADLSRTSKSLHTLIHNDGWKTFSKTRFPSVCPNDTSSYHDAARTLTTLSKAWDKRAFVARYVQPRAPITSYPGARVVDRWKRPQGQTIGFTPQLDVHEVTGSVWHDRDETLVFSTGAEICIRSTRASRTNADVHWTTYRPQSAAEGRDDVTALHLMHSHSRQRTEDSRLHIVTGTANGDLQLVRLPTYESSSRDVSISSFTTQGLPVRSSSLYQGDAGVPALLAASLGDARVALYPVDSENAKTRPISQIDVQPDLDIDGNPRTSHRTWSTTFLNSNALAIGSGHSDRPLHVHHITESGLTQAPTRKFGLNIDQGNVRPFTKRTAVYTTHALPSSGGSRGDGNVFLSGSYDGIVRLHDLRSSRDVEQCYVDPTDDSAVYSILTRGREKMMTGSSRHNLLKVFDMRLGAKCYSFLDADSSLSQECRATDRDYNIFLRPKNRSNSRGSGWTHGRHRSAESSVYSLASSSSSSPFVYAGVENAVWSLAFTEARDPYPDCAYFDPWTIKADYRSEPSPRAVRPKEVVDLAMYEQDADMKLHHQRSLWETWQTRNAREEIAQPWLDARWKSASQ